MDSITIMCPHNEEEIEVGVHYTAARPGSWGPNEGSPPEDEEWDLEYQHCSCSLPWSNKISNDFEDRAIAKFIASLDAHDDDCEHGGDRDDD